MFSILVIKEWLILLLSHFDMILLMVFMLHSYA